jgi:hypothetical protein
MLRQLSMLRVARTVLIVLTVLAWTTRCTRHATIFSTCQLPPWFSINTNHDSLHKRRDLPQDAEFVEDVAIRYADHCCGPHSGHFRDLGEYGRVRDQCMTGLFGVVASKYGVTDTQVRMSLSLRPIYFDVAVIGSFVFFYAWASRKIVRKNAARHAERGKWWNVIVAAYLSVIVATVGLMAGEFWSDSFESIRLGNGHLSDRGERLPWHHHRLAVFVCGLIIFWMLTAVHKYGVAQVWKFSLSHTRRSEMAADAPNH